MGTDQIIDFVIEDINAIKQAGIGLVGERQFEGIDGFRIEVVIADIDGIVGDIQLVQGRGAKRPAIQKLRGQIIRGGPDKGSAGIDGSTEVGVIVVAQAAHQLPVLGKLPLVLDERVVVLPVLFRHPDLIGVVRNIDNLALRTEIGIEVFTLCDLIKIGPEGADARENTVIVNRAVYGTQIQPDLLFFVTGTAQKAVRKGATKSAWWEQENVVFRLLSEVEIANAGFDVQTIYDFQPLVAVIDIDPLGLVAPFGIKCLGQAGPSTYVPAILHTGPEFPACAIEFQPGVELVCGRVYRAGRQRG